MFSLLNPRGYFSFDTANEGDKGGTWIDTLPEEVRTGIGEEFTKDPNISKYKTLPDFLKGHKNAVELVGRKGVILPTDKSTPEEVAEYRKTMGIPDKPEGYKFTMPKELHASIKPTPESEKAFSEFALKSGFSGKQADELNAWYLSTLSEYMKQQDIKNVEQVKSLETALRSEWAADYDTKVALASKIANQVGGKDLLEGLGDKVNDPRVMKFLAKIGGTMSEDVIKSIGVQPENTGAGDVLKQIDAIYKDSKHPYWNDKHPDHNKWVGPDGEMRKLYQKAYPEKAAA